MLLKSISDVETISQMFDKPVEFTQLIMEKHNVVSLPAQRFNGDGLDEFYSDMTSYYTEEPSLTKQEFTESSDPNFIIDRHKRGQDISMSLTAKPIYGDFSNIPASYHEALNIVTSANQSFMQLDARVRAKFNNDPGAFVEFASNPENCEELKKLGIDSPFAQSGSTSQPDTTSTSESQNDAPVVGSGGGGEGA